MVDENAEAIVEILKKGQKFTADDLQVLRQHSGGVALLSGKSDWFTSRMDVELIDAIRKLDETSTELINKTNQLTSRIRWLTVVGVVVALTGVAVTVATAFR